MIAGGQDDADAALGVGVFDHCFEQGGADALGSVFGEDEASISLEAVPPMTDGLLPSHP